MNHHPADTTTGPTSRRGFLKKSLTLALGAVSLLVPVFAIFSAISDPLRRKGALGQSVRITTLAALPKDGLPHKFPVMTSKTDAWVKYDNVAVGAVYLRWLGNDKLEALNVVCPHAGCFVDFSSKSKKFLCPCHNSSFALDGSISDPRSPSPRGLDTLPVELREDGSIWVAFQNYKAGAGRKIPVT